MIWLHRIIVTYMVANIMHIPFPVFDGDNLKSGESRHSVATSPADKYDVDFIFLGCDPPDDSDDGPVDDDPENESNSALASLLLRLNSRCQSLLQLDWHIQGYPWSLSGPSPQVSFATMRAEGAFRFFSFGKLCQSGSAHLRC